MIKTFSLCFVLLGLIACSSVPKNSSSSPPQKNNLNEAYTTLYELASKQKDLDKIGIIKTISPEITPLLKDIAKVSGKLAKTIDAWAEQKLDVQLDHNALPQFESETRKEIEFVTTKKIIGTSGAQLEKLLILKQNEALNYQAALCRWISQNEKNELRRETIQDFEKRLSKLNRRAFEAL